MVGLILGFENCNKLNQYPYSHATISKFTLTPRLGQKRNEFYELVHTQEEISAYNSNMPSI